MQLVATQSQLLRLLFHIPSYSIHFVGDLDDFINITIPSLSPSLPSYDTRGAHAGTPSEWHDMEVLENRARLDKNTGPAVLIIDPVTEKDAGNFRCRVDFKLSPTRNSNVNLEVIGEEWLLQQV